MQQLKYLLFGLLILISLSLIFTNPGLSFFEKFYHLTKSLPSIFVSYPPSTYFILQIILHYFPPDTNVYFFYQQTAWTIYKLVLYGGYMLSLLSFIYLIKQRKKQLQNSSINIIIAFPLSLSILLLTLGLASYEILAVPFFILSVHFIINKNSLVSSILFLVSLSFNWSLWVLGPLFFIFSYRSKVNKLPYVISFLFIPLSILISTVIIPLLGLLNSGQAVLPTRLFSFILYLSQPISLASLPYYLATNTASSVGHITGIIALSTTVIGFWYLLQKIYLNDIIYSLAIRLNKKVTCLVIILILLFLVGKTSLAFIILFFLLYLPLIYKLSIAKVFTPTTWLTGLFCGYLISVIFLPGIPLGNSIWLIIISLIAFVFYRSKITTLQLITVNLLSFINAFIYYGDAGISPINSVYFILFQPIFLLSFIFFSIWYITTAYQSEFNIISSAVQSDKIIAFFKKFLVVFLILVNASLIPASGTGDVVSYNDTALVTVKYLNPFKAYSLDQEMYPPLSTVIISSFANSWKMVFGPTDNYKLAIKISVFVFYFLTLFVFLKYASGLRKNTTLSTTEKILVYLSTFALIIQTQGFSDVNIYLIPTLILSFITLFKKRYLLSGILLGITVTIKWQPLLLLPLFGATIIYSRPKDLRRGIKQTAVFLLGLVTVVVSVLVSILIQPNGYRSFYRTMDYMFNFSGFHLLSGQALNLNWIVTYFLHIFQPKVFGSLNDWNWINHYVASDNAPILFRGIFFNLVALIVIFKYWCFQKKTSLNFLFATLMIFFSHFILNKSAHEKHLFYTLILMLLIYFVRPNNFNRWLLILFDVMAGMNLIFFFGFNGSSNVNRLFFGFDITVLFAAYYVIIYLWFLIQYLKTKEWL